MVEDQLSALTVLSTSRAILISALRDPLVHKGFVADEIARKHQECELYSCLCLATDIHGFFVCILFSTNVI